VLYPLWPLQFCFPCVCFCTCYHICYFKHKSDHTILMSHIRHINMFARTFNIQPLSEFLALFWFWFLLAIYSAIMIFSFLMLYCFKTMTITIFSFFSPTYFLSVSQTSTLWQSIKKIYLCWRQGQAVKLLPKKCIVLRSNPNPTKIKENLSLLHWPCSVNHS
jgi:hypothetical protein